MNIKKKNYRKIILVSTLLVLIAGGAVVYWYYGRQPQQPTTASPYTKGESSSDNTANSGDGSNSSALTPGSTQPGDDKSDRGDSVDAILTSPTGEFVSNHRPGNNGSPLSEVSVCNTTPGATCQIVFTKGSTVKTLSSELVDRGGAAYWNNWTPSSVGLTKGQWQVTAVATLNGQTKRATDTTPLEVL